MDKQDIVEDIIEGTKEDAAIRFEADEDIVSSEQQVEALLKARYPLIQVVT